MYILYHSSSISLLLHKSEVKPRMSGHNRLLSHQIVQESKKLLMCYLIKTPRTLLYTVIVIPQAITDIYSKIL